MKKGMRFYSESFSLLELLVVVAIMVILIILLLPAVHSARSAGRKAYCAANLHAIAQAAEAYYSTYNDYLVGSPNTSGNGANPGGVRLELYPEYYDRPEEDNQTYPAVHIFDWATPLQLMMKIPIADNVSDRYDQSKHGAFLCPANSWKAFLNHESRIDIETLVSSYVSCKFFTYAPTSRRTGTQAGSIFWTHDFVPEDFFPKITRIANISWKVFLADGCKIDRGNPRKISNMDYGYTERGAWLNVKNPDTNDDVSLSYRFEFGRRQSYRHLGGLNLLFFDGHVEHQPEGSSEANGGAGTGSRQAKFWFPSGTKTDEIPREAAFTNPTMTVP